MFAAIQISRIKAPHVGQIGRSTTRSGKEIVLKGATDNLVRSGVPVACRTGMPPTATEVASEGPVAATMLKVRRERLRLFLGHKVRAAYWVAPAY